MGGQGIERREALTIERQLTEGLTIRDDVGRKEDGFRHQRLGLC